MHKKVQVFILTYNRPNTILQSLDSVLKQSYKDIEIIVSDNSNNIKTKELLSREEYNNKLTYIHRDPSLPPLQHFNTILKEVTSDYFMMFHDDDTMCNNMVSTLVNELKNNELAVAVGANAYVFVNSNLQKRLFLKKNIKNRTIKDRTELAKYYLEKSIVPFPSYLYKKKVSSDLLLDSRFGGKHSDVSFLMNVCSLGQIINLEIPVMYYNFHQTQDSSSFDYFSMNSLISYIIRTTDFTKNNNAVLKFRTLSLYSYSLTNLKNQAFSICGWRWKKILSIMFQIYPLTYFLKLITKLIISKFAGLIKK